MAFPSYVKVLADGFGLQDQIGAQRTAMDDGFVKQLQTKSKVLVTRSVTFQLSSLADLNSFLTYYRVTLNRGASWFTWTDPLDGVAKQARIPVGTLGKAEPIQGMISKWNIQAQIETYE